MPTSLLRLAAACLALGVAAGAHAAGAVIGSVLAVRGTVYVDAPGNRQALATSAAVHVDDTIVSADGKAKIGLHDGTVISIGENSRVRLVEFAESGRPARARMHLLLGVIRVNAKLSPGGTFEVETETAIAAVRGTDWVVDAGADQTAVAVVTGSVAVTSRTTPQPVTVVLDGPAMGTDVRRGSPPTPPVRWGAKRYESTLARATFD